MKTRSYHKEIQLNTAQVLDLFNDITIDRRTMDNSIQQTFKVSCVYGSRRRILKSLENRGNNLKLPIICITIAGISRDSSRTFGVNDGLLTQDGSGNYNYKKNTPTPINIEYSLEILTKFQEDMDQIIGNFVPFFNPDVFVVVPNPQNDTLNLKSQVIWGGNFSVNYNDDISPNTPQRVEATTSFTLKTWLFAGLDSDEYAPHKIKRINFNPCIQWENGIGRLSNWYAVPNTMSFNTYKNNIICGYIHPDFYDELQISAGVSGYWMDLSGLVTGLSLAPIGSSDITGLMYLTTDEGGLLMLSPHCYLPCGMATLPSGAWLDYYASTISGDLSGYGQCPPYITE